ncbi:MAG TPA: hypothetical protein VKT72_13055 [Candidatus Baltobacteraceae bacterium]|nr:hypothetical protein [Candidatus Baltobacteraceae bacterium]
MPELESGDSLFDGVVGNEDDILPLTAWVPSELERIGYFADYYTERARDLVQRSLHTNLGAENYFYVVAFLYRHAIELYLKSIIASPSSFRSLPEAQQTSLIWGHDLEELWNRARPIAQRFVDDEYLKLADGPVMELHAFDKGSDAFRYPFKIENRKTGVRKPLLDNLGQISFHNFVWVIEGLVTWFKGVENARGIRG